MKLLSAHLKNLEELYGASLEKTLDMEQQITEGLKVMIAKSTDPELRAGFEQHLAETKNHATQVEQILISLKGEATPQTCKVASALISECSDMIKDADNESVTDVSLIAAGQQVEHHEIAIYGTLATWADLLGRDEDVAILEQILEEEKNADVVLSTAADKLNSDAQVAV